MWEALNFFKNHEYDKYVGLGDRQHNKTMIKDVVLGEFLQLLKEKHLVGQLLELLNILK